MDLLPALAASLASSAAGVLRESAAARTISRRLKRRTMSSAEVCWPVPMRAIGAQNLLTMPGGVTTAGYLHKKGGSQFSLMKWPLRYIILHKGCVYYFKTSTSPAPQGAFSLNGYNRVMRAAEETTSNNVFPFKIVHFSKKHRTWLFSAASEEERRKWMRCLRREIDHYNDRKEAHIPSDSDSDADSFYGTIEKPMDIKHPVDSPEDDYVEEDDDEDEEDYLKPDGDCAPTGRPAGPPPSYPPPPVPHTFQGRQDPAFHKGPAPSVPPLNKSPTIPLPKKPPPSALKDPGKAPPTLPFPPHPHRNLSPSPPPPPPPNPKRGLHSRAASVAAADRREWRPPPPALHLPATLPICEQLESRMVLNGPAHHHHPHAAVGGQLSKPVPPLPQARRSPPQMPVPMVLPPLPRHPPVSPLNKPSKPPPPIAKPPLPAGKSKPTSFQRASPEGQSFRSQVDETPADFRVKPEKWGEGGSDRGEDYENVQLPESVFIDTVETSVVEKLFRESFSPPQDGLYGIRNSGTKTSKVLVVWDSSIGKARNYRLFEENDCVFLDTDLTFLTLAALIEHYYSHPLPHHGSLCLQEPYTEPGANKN